MKNLLKQISFPNIIRLEHYYKQKNSCSIFFYIGKNKSRCTKEWKNASIRPEIENPISDMAQYDIIFVGYPIWYEKAPNIIYTFLESYDFSNKTIVPFSTSGGSIRGSMGKHLHKYCLKQTNWKTGSGVLMKYIDEKVSRSFGLQTETLKSLGTFNNET